MLFLCPIFSFLIVSLLFSWSTGVLVLAAVLVIVYSYHHLLVVSVIFKAYRILQCHPSHLVSSPIVRLSTTQVGQDIRSLLGPCTRSRLQEFEGRLEALPLVRIEIV